MSHAPGHLDSSSLLPSDELTHVGRYELIMPLGKGGMAHVYLARNVGSAGFQRLAAIKVMHRNLAANDEFVEMFLDEARVAACIHHPNVVPIIDLGIEGDQLYMVMDYVEGDTLAAVQRTAISLGRMIPIGIVLRMALDALTTCPCNQNPDKDGCYRCLYQYRLGRSMAMVSRRRAVEVLDELLGKLDQLEQVKSITLKQIIVGY